MSETHPSLCRICWAQCPILVEVEDGRAIRVTGDPDNDFFGGYTCAKGRALPEQHAAPSRLLHSLKRDADGVRRPIASERAMDEIAERVAAIVAEHGPRAVALYVGTGTFPYPASVATASAWLRGLGSPMFFTPATIDQPGKAIAMSLHGGWRAGDQDFEQADTWLMVGMNPLISKCNGIPSQNPGRKLKDAVDRGMRFIAIDPRRTETARRAAIHLQARPGEDPTILAGLVHVILEEGLTDAAFVGENAEGLERLTEAVRDFTPDYVGARAGVAAEDVVRAARLFAGARRGCATAGTGPSFATRGTLTEYLLLCLNTLCGRWARAGEKVLRPNVMLPAYTARAQPYPPFPGWGYGEKLRVRGFTDSVCGLPTAALADEILLEGEGQVKALFCLGGNPMMAWPDQRRTRAALDELELLVAVDAELSATAQLADYVIAPQLSLETPGMTQAAEWGKFYAYGLGFSRPWAQYTPRIAEPPEGSDVIEDWTFFHGLARRLETPLQVVNFFGAGQHVESPMEVFSIDLEHPPTTDEIYAQITQNARIPLEEVKRHPRGRVFDEIDERVQPREEGNTDRLQLGDAHMMSALREVREEDYEGRRSDADYPFLLVSRRSNNFMNSIGRSVEKLAGSKTYNPAFVHPDDLAALGIASGDSVEIRSAHDAIWAVAEADDTLRRGVVSMTHAFGGQPDEDARHRELGSNVGRLTSVELDYDPVSGIPRMSALPVALAPLAARAAAS